MDKKHKLIILLVIATPFALTAVIWAWVDNNYYPVANYGFWLICWFAYIIVTIRKIKNSQRRDKKIHQINKDSSLKLKIVIERICWIAILFTNFALLTWSILSQFPVFFIFASIWFIIISLGHLFYIGPLNIEWNESWW